MTPEVIVAGHVCLDVIPHLAGPLDLRPGGLQFIGPAAVATGGAVPNTGLALHRLGVAVRLMGKVGDDAFGRAVLDVLNGCDARLSRGMIVTPGATTSYSIVVSPPGVDRSFLHCPGANDTFSSADVDDASLGGAKIFHFGYPPVMRNMYVNDGADLRVLMSRVRGAGLVTSLDLCQPDPNSDAGRADWAKILGNVLPFVDVFQPSLDELMFMVDRDATGWDLRTLRSLSDRLTSWGAAVVTIKLGEGGLYVRTSFDRTRVAALCERLNLRAEDWTDREVLSPCFRASQVAGTTGSGDCTIAGFLAALLRRENPTDAATSATAVGACGVEAADATSGVRPWSDTARRIERRWSRLPVSLQLPPGAVVDARGTITFTPAGGLP